MEQIVISDPVGKYIDGALVNHNEAVQIRGRKGFTLPVDPSLFQVSGCGGYFKREYGEGIPVEHSVPKQFCPMTLYLTKEHRIAHWAVRLIPDPNKLNIVAEGPTDSGTIALSSSPPRGNAYQATIQPRTNSKRLKDLGPPDANGGWTLEGNAFLNVMNDGNHSFCLYGSGSGVRVAWVAITAVRA